MKEKRCFKCGRKKLLDKFYKHKQMTDGHLNKCIECAVNDVRIREQRLCEDLEWVKAEKVRQREKYYRLGYKGKWKPSKQEKKNINLRYRKKFPEKLNAICHSQHVDIQDGLHKHHWNYQEEYWKDIIPLSMNVHKRLHCFIIYDQKRMMYRKLNGELLDNKSKHVNYINSLPF